MTNIKTRTFKVVVEFRHIDRDDSLYCGSNPMTSIFSLDDPSTRDYRRGDRFELVGRFDDPDERLFDPNWKRLRPAFAADELEYLLQTGRLEEI